MVRRMLGGGLVAALLVTGCATKRFVRDEVARSQERVGADVGRLDRALAEERARRQDVERGLGETRAAAAEAARRATEAAGLVGQAASKADEATSAATGALGRADAAAASAREALAKTTETEERLTRLWASRGKRTLTDTRVVRFAFDQWVLDDSAQTTLLALVEELRLKPDLVVELEGYTDSTGPSAYNVQLSQRRAEAVRRFLFEKGIEMPRIHTIGLGDIRPVADNKTRQGRDQNRRVSIRVFAPAE